MTSPIQGSARVRIEADTSALPGQVMAGVQAALAEAEAAIVSTFESAFEQAAAAAAGLGDEGLSEVADAAEQAASEVAADFDAAAAEANAALSTIGDGGLDEAAAAAEVAGDQVAAAFETAADQADTALGNVGSSGFDGVASSAGDAADEVAEQFEQSAGRAESAFDGLAGLIAGVGLTAALRSATLDAQALNSAIAVTEQVILSTGGAAGVAADQIRSLAQDLSFRIGIDAVEVQEAANLMLTFRNVTQEVFAESIELAADMSTVLGTDLQGSVLQLGKALNDPVLGVTALSRAGVQFTEQQRDLIRTLVESGDLLAAQTIILDELRGQVGGVAEASADSTARIGAAWAELRRELGAPIISAIDELAPELINTSTELVPALTSIGEAIADIVAVSPSLLTALLPLVEVLAVAAELFTALPTPMQTVIVSLAAMVALGPRVAAFGAAFAALPARVGAAVTSMRAATTSLAATRTALTGVTAALGGPWGVAIAAGVTGLSLLAEGSRDAAANTQDLSEDLDRLAERGRLSGELLRIAGDDGADFASKIDLAAERAGFLGGRLNGVLEQVNQVPDAFTSAAGIIDATSSEAGDAAQDIEALDEALAQTIRSGTDADEVIGALQETYGLTDEQLQRLMDIMPQTNTAIQRQGDLARDTAEDQAGLADATREAVEAMREQADQVLADLDPMFALNQALGEVRDAQQAFSEAVDAHGPKSQEATDAAFGLTQASLRLQGAVGDAAGTFTGQMDPALEANLRALGLTEDELDVVRGAFRRTAEEGDDFARTYIAHAELRGAGEVERRARELQRELDGIDRQIAIEIAFQEVTGRPSGLPGSFGRALGGVITQPELSWLGEDWNPEVVLPLTRPDRMTELVGDRLVREPVAAALGRTLRGVDRETRDSVLVTLLGQLGAPAPALAGGVRLDAAPLFPADAPAGGGGDGELLAEVQRLREELGAIRGGLAAARQINVTQAPGEDGESLSRRVVSRLTVAAGVS